MTAKKTPKFLKHYTKIESLFKILDTGYLLLNDPKNWEKDDKNDCAALLAFCRLKGEGTKAGVLCLAEGNEVIHHWNTYAKDGCYIEFYENELLKEVVGPRFLHGFVKYKSMEELTNAYLNRLKPNTIPFLKRGPYKCDKEYRVVWFGIGKEIDRIPLKKSAIKRITLSPYLDEREKLQGKIKEKLEKQYGKNGIRVELSHLLESDRWISKFENLGKKR